MIVLPYDSSAPWNEREPESATERKKVCLYVTKEMELETYDTETDEDEGHEITVARDDADWHQAYKDNGFNLTSLLGTLMQIAEEKAADIEKATPKGLTHNCKMMRAEAQHWRKIAEACKGWQVEEIEIDDV